jgi:hypothetical protein
MHIAVPGAPSYDRTGTARAVGISPKTLLRWMKGEAQRFVGYIKKEQSPTNR